jgi:O-antigen ligase
MNALCNMRCSDTYAVFTLRGFGPVLMTGRQGEPPNMSYSSRQSAFLVSMPVIEALLNASAIFIMATMYWFWDASRAAFVLLCLGALVFTIKYRPRLPRDHRFYSWPIIGFVGATFLSLMYHGMPDSGVNRFVSRYLFLVLAIPLVSVFYLSYDPKRNPWIKYAAGCLVMGALALADIFVLGETRADAGHNAVGFGVIAMAMTSIVIASYYRFSQVRFGRAVYFLTISMGVCAVILSGTRTGWLAGFVVFVAAMFFYLERYSVLKRVLFSLALIGCIAIAASSIPLVQNRIDHMIEIFEPYVKGEEQTEFNSLRDRVEAWKAGWQMGMENKILGFGPGNTKPALEEYARKNPELKKLANVNHIHNQFLQTFAMTGLVGLFSLLVLLGCHLWLFTKYLAKQYSMEVRSLSLAGLLLMIAYLVMSIPTVPFYGKKYLMMYAFSSASIWGCLLGALRHSRQAGSVEPVID